MSKAGGPRVLRDAIANRGTGFSVDERLRLGLTGLLPPAVEPIERQAERVMARIRALPTPIDKYCHLRAVQDENEALFFHALMGHMEELVPIVYTPTVGQACLDWSRIYLRPRGLYITMRERGRVRELLRRWPRPAVGVIVVTDGGRILGLGDLGANGMGIPIGKLALYVACAGVDPARCLPVTLDVGTDAAAVRDDPFYLGVRDRRARDAAYDELVEEFVQAVQEVFPGALLQFEDFGNAEAFRLLARYRDRICCFNDDIQGTGAMALAGIRAALEIGEERLAEQRVLFFGAGEANIGIGTLLVAALRQEGLGEAEARSRCWYFDSRGLVTTARADLPAHKRPLAREGAPSPDLLSAIEAVRPTVLIGASGRGGAFDEAVLAAMARHNDRPVVFALSNPTSKAECTAEQAYRATQGRAIFASGSPFGPAAFGGRTYETGQANNSFVFPGLGMGVLASGATRVSTEMLFAAARALGEQVGEQDLAAGRVYPPASRLRDVALAVAVAVAETAYAMGLSSTPRPSGDLAAALREGMYQPRYA
jgi:malate dehydrogenase (oxaloacetate-decarboxylating)(NADP+)